VSVTEQYPRTRRSLYYVILAQLIRHRAERMYPTTLGVRAFFIATLAALYVDSRN
jgi:hypothetical protein